MTLNEGLAIADSSTGGWSYLCPRLWGDADTSAGKIPVALSSDGARSWIVGADDLYVESAGKLAPQSRPDLNRNHILALAALENAVFGLHIDGAKTDLIQVDAQEITPLWSSDQYWSSMTALADRIYLSGAVSQTKLAFLTLDRHGQVLENVETELERAPQTVQLQPTTKGLYIVTYDGAQYTLGTVTDGKWTRVLQSEGAIYGPQQSVSGQLFVSVNGMLMREGAQGFEPVGDARIVSCLAQWGSLAYACAGTELYRLGDNGLEERLFTLDALFSPNPMIVDDAASRDCMFQWLLFKNDIERSGYKTREWAATGDGAAGAAGVGGNGAVTAGAGPIAAAAGAAAGVATAGAPGPTPEAGAPAPAAKAGGCGVVTARTASPFCALLTLASGFIAYSYRRRRHTR